jgi:putative endonuclease
MGWIEWQASALRRMDALALRMQRGRTAEHLATGASGEREALFHLRKLGYTVVARRWRSPKLRGDVDLIAWDGEWLCFVEVKTRSSRDLVTAEAAVDEEKQQMLRRMARAYLRGFAEEARGSIPVRFDVVSVYMQPGGCEFEVQKGAFRWA